MEIKPYDERVMIRREYTMVEMLLRKIFNIPTDEMVLDLVWDKSNGRLKLTTLKDKDFSGDNY